MPPPPCVWYRVCGGGGYASLNPVAKILPGVPPFRPKFPNFELNLLPEAPCAVALDQWGDSSVGGCYMGEVGEGGAVWNLLPVD